ncbi:MAG: Stringent starvation protein [Pseudomonadota bacterium]|jgi:glutathione S-transferase
MKLYIANKNYSSWSMRPGVMLKQAGIAHEEVMVRFDGFDAQSQFKQTLKDINPVGKVPVLVDGDIVVWDTLAIAEYVAEKFPEKKLWPTAVADRARARSICAEMHSGFMGIRSACPMNIDADLPEIGALAMRDKDALRQDLKRIDSLFSSLLKQHKGPMLFGEFTIPDAYFAPVVMRIKTYALPVSAETQAYMDRLCATPGVKAWIDGALAEKDFIDIEEPFRTKP